MSYKIDDKYFIKKFDFKFGTRYFGQTYYIIHKALLLLNFNISSIGFDYWIRAIMIYRHNKNKYDNTIESVYNEIALEKNTTRDRVERAMRTARVNSNEEIKKAFNYNSKLTNKKVLELLTNNFFIMNKEE